MPVIGIDVSKNKLHCALLSERGKLKSKAFPNSASACLASALGDAPSANAR